MNKTDFLRGVAVGWIACPITLIIIGMIAKLIQ